MSSRQLFGPRRRSFYLVIAVFCLVLVLRLRGEGEAETRNGSKVREPQRLGKRRHPIERLIEQGEKEFDELLKQRTLTLHQAAQAYRQRRGRHPPPSFDVWYQYARSVDSVMIESIYDQIYHDLGPFWGQKPQLIRWTAQTFTRNPRDQDYGLQTIVIRDGMVTSSGWFWIGIWSDMIATIAKYLPDMDIPINVLDESRLIVPYEWIADLMAIGKKEKRMSAEIQDWPVNKEADKAVFEALADQISFERPEPPFSFLRDACPPSSPVRRRPLQTNFTQPVFTDEFSIKYMSEGFVANYTQSTSICHQHDLQGLHGALIEPQTIRLSKQLLPIFGGSKLGINNEILIPAAFYWLPTGDFASPELTSHPWEEKRAGSYWRGTASGGKNKPENWKSFHRHRFVAMTNVTEIEKLELEAALGKADAQTGLWHYLGSFFSRPRLFDETLNRAGKAIWPYPGPAYDIPAVREHKLSQMADDLADTGFTGLQCTDGDRTDPDAKTCPYVDHAYKSIDAAPFGSLFNYKILPDIDGNSFSGRYRSFLLSNSLPVKATIFREWHESRLIPWKHFVPMDNRFFDWWGILDYFSHWSFFARPVHKGEADVLVRKGDDDARRIAEAGSIWGKKVLRPEDMQVYTLRLLLEYARVCNDYRDRLGYAGDLKSRPSR